LLTLVAHTLLLEVISIFPKTSLDGITHRSVGCSCLPITMSRGRNPNACQILNGVRTVLPRRPDRCTWMLDSSRTLNSDWTICHYIWTDANLNCSNLLDTDGGPNGCCWLKSVRTEYNIVRTDARELNWLIWILHKVFLKLITKV
jgi:hypothetical protein